jgi:hypothetical protein
MNHLTITDRKLTAKQIEAKNPHENNERIGIRNIENGRMRILKG